MDQHTRERALRALVAALLNSGLTPKEIREVAQSVKTDPSVGEQLARLVDILVENLPKPIASKRLPRRPADSPLLDAGQFLRAAEAVNLPKDILVNRLQSYTQRPDWKPNRRWSRGRILREFITIAPPSSLRPALSALQVGPVEPDPFVDLILTRDKAGNG